VRDFWLILKTPNMSAIKEKNMGIGKTNDNKIFQHLPCFVPLPALAAFAIGPRSAAIFNWQACGGQ